MQLLISSYSAVFWGMLTRDVDPLNLLEIDPINPPRWPGVSPGPSCHTRARVYMEAYLTLSNPRVPKAHVCQTNSKGVWFSLNRKNQAMYPKDHQKVMVDQFDHHFLTFFPYLNSNLKGYPIETPRFSHQATAQPQVLPAEHAV